MTEPNRGGNATFLSKFEGRTNKVGKQGINAVLTAAKQQLHKGGQQSDQFRKVDLDMLIPSNPERKLNKQTAENSIKRRQSLNPPLKSTETKTYVPSAYTPQTTSKDQLSYMGSLSNSGSPPSRSYSNSAANSRNKYVFGKYLKLDKQALSHIQFIQGIEQKSLFRKNSRFSSQHS